MESIKKYKLNSDGYLYESTEGTLLKLEDIKVELEDICESNAPENNDIGDSYKDLYENLLNDVRKLLTSL